MFSYLSRVSKALWFRSLLLLLLIILFIVFIVHEREALLQLPDILGNANTDFILIGAILTLLFVICEGLLYQACFTSVGRRVPLFYAVRLYLKRFFVSSFIPAGFTVSQYAFTNDLEKHHVTPMESHMASSVYIIVIAAAYQAVLLPTIGYLLVTGQLTAVEFYAGVLVALCSLIIIGLFISAVRQQGVAYYLAKLAFPDLPQFLNTWRKKSYRKTTIIRSFVFALLLHAIGTALLYVVLRAVHVDASLMLAAVGYVISLLVLMISPIFQGVGFVEISLVFVLQQHGVPHGAAVAVTLLYRVFQLWLPLLMGAGLFAHKRVKHLAPVLTEELK